MKGDGDIQIFGNRHIRQVCPVRTLQSGVRKSGSYAALSSQRRSAGSLPSVQALGDLDRNKVSPPVVTLCLLPW